MEVVSKIVEGRWLSKQKLMDLLWEDKEKRICESLFPMPRNFALDRYASTPYVDFMPGYREDIEVGYREQRRKKEAFARRYLDEDGRVKEDSIPIFIAYRDGLKTQICYYGDKLRMGPLCEIRQEFKFIFEEEININNNKKGNKYEEIE